MTEDNARAFQVRARSFPGYFRRAETRGNGPASRPERFLAMHYSRLSPIGFTDDSRAARVGSLRNLAGYSFGGHYSAIPRIPGGVSRDEVITPRQFYTSAPSLYEPAVKRAAGTSPPARRLISRRCRFIEEFFFTRLPRARRCFAARHRRVEITRRGAPVSDGRLGRRHFRGFL